MTRAAKVQHCAGGAGVYSQKEARKQSGAPNGYGRTQTLSFLPGSGGTDSLFGSLRQSLASDLQPVRHGY